MAHDRTQPDSDRMLAGRLTSISQRHAQWGELSEEQRAAGAAELREIAGDRPDLLAEVAGIALGAGASKGPEYSAQAQAIAELCRMAGADEDQIAGWIEVGRERAEARRLPPFSQPRRTRPRP